MLRSLGWRLTGVVAEAAMVAGLLVLPWWNAWIFAAVTALLGLIVGYRFETSRLPYEISYFYERPGRLARVFSRLFVTGEVIVRACIAGLATLFVFLGTNSARIAVAVLAFAMLAIAGSWLMRLVGLVTRLRPARWGYFRLSLLLGLAFSASTALFKRNPGVEQALVQMLDSVVRRQSPADIAEAIHSAKTELDLVIGALLRTLFGTDIGNALSLFLSFDTIQGFALAVYAVLLTEAARYFTARENDA
jgi:hypothetical protein